MNIAKLAVLLGAIVLAAGGIGAALAESRNSGDDGVEPIDIEARKNELDDGVLLFADDDDDGDGDSTRGDDGTSDGANTRVPAPVRAGDGDNTRGDDGTSGGNNTRVAPAPAPTPPPAPAPAPAPPMSDGGTTGGGESVTDRGSISGGGDT